MSTTTGSIPDVIKDGDSGFLVFLVMSPHWPGIVRLGDASLRHAMGKTRGRQWVQTYSIDRMVDELEQVYRQVMSRSGSAS